MTRTATLSGKPGGTFRIGPAGRNVAFFREASSSGGNFTAGPMTGVFTQAGSYSVTREDSVYDENDNPHTVITQDSSGDCADRKTARFSPHAVFRVRSGKLAGVFTLPDYPALKDCQGALDAPPAFVTTPSGIARSRAFAARTLKFPVSYRRARTHKEDGATITQVVTWKGSVSLTRVKTCVFRRGGNQDACAGHNPDSL